MVRPFNPDKYRKSITKSIKGISAGFNDPDTWVSTGNHTLNYLISQCTKTRHFRCSTRLRERT
jgi:hypothetical protein